MFDWARGSMLKNLLGRNFFRGDWEPRGATGLKNWHASWLLGLIELAPNMRVLDVGSARPTFMQYVHQHHGCEVHALDADSESASQAKWGISAEVAKEFPEVHLHLGLAGEDLLPAEHFDLVTCISTLEHTYDHDSPVLSHRPMPHLHALRDMVRMLKPGGVFLMNWDLFLDNIPQNIGWDFEVDYQVLKASGMRLMSNRRRLRNIPYIFSHPDTLFFEPVKVLKFERGQLRRGTAINILWRKPGNVSNIRLCPLPELEPLYFPDDETMTDPAEETGPELSTAEIDARFRQLISSVIDVIGRTDVDGLNHPTKPAAT